MTGPAVGKSAPPRGWGLLGGIPRMLGITVWLHVTGRRIWAPWGRADTAGSPGGGAAGGRERRPEGGLAPSGSVQAGGAGSGPRADPRPPAVRHQGEEREAEAQAALEANSEGSLTRPKAIPPGCGDAAEEEDESILDTVIKYLPGALQDIFKK